MKVLHPDPRPTAPSALAHGPGHLVAAVLALAPLLLATCTANCPPLAHPEVLTVAATSNPCRARAESAAHLALRVAPVCRRPAGSGR